MSGKSCTCENGGLANIAVAKCPPRFKNVVSMFLTPMNNSTGEFNAIPLTAVPLTGIDLLALTNNEDATARLYPIHGLKNVKFPKEETKYETASGGEKAKLRDGLQSFESEVWENGFVFACKLRENECSKMGVYFLDASGQILGVKKGQTLRPIPLDAFDPNYMFATDDATDKTMIKFDFARSIDVCDYSLITSGFINQTNSPFDLLGLLDANISKIASTASDLKVKVYSDYTSDNPLLANVRGIQGLTSSNFSLFNKTENLAIVVVSVIVNPLGTDYTVTFASQNIGDQIEVKINAFALGYEGVETITL